MRRFGCHIITLILALQLIPGCRQGGPDPGEVTLKFLNAIQQSNYTEAKKYATEDSKAMLDALAAFQQMLPEASRQKFKNGKIAIADIEKNDSLAVVTYRSDQDSTRKTLKLKKQQGRWKVAFTKETVLPDLNKPLNEQDSTLLNPNPEPVPADS